MATRKERHEEFVSNLSGGDIMEIYAIISTMTILFIISDVAWQKFKKCRLLFDFLIGIIPSILLLTILSDNVYICSLVCILLVSIISFIMRRDMSSSNDGLQSLLDKKNHFILINTYRGIGLITTSICILAVDFPSYPRRFAKAETYGTGLMDFGVGGFSLMMGLVASETRGGSTNLKRSFQKTFIPLIVLGVVRMLSVKGANYQEHASEYGIHWNFFFTLACVKMISSLVMRWLRVSAAILATISMAVHDFNLKMGLSDWMMNSPRTNFLTANKEGFGSILGYVSLFLWGVAFGQLISSLLLADKSKKRHVLTKLIVWCFGGFVIGSALTQIIGPVSRRFANGAYISWTISNSCLTFVIILFGQRLGMTCTESSPATSSALTDQPILFLYNHSAMTYFLLSNLLTGLVNIAMDTLLINGFVSVIILIVYQIVALILVSAFNFRFP